MSKKLSEEKIEQVFILYEQYQSMSKVATLLKISKGTVHNVLRNERKGSEHERMLNDYKIVKEKSNMKLLDMMQSSLVDNVVEKAIGKLTDENMNADISRNGIGNMYRLIGMFTDKSISIRELDIKLKQLTIREKELSIKEKELELRISNPEAFHTVQIINDAPPTSDEYEPRIANQ